MDDALVEGQIQKIRPSKDTLRLILSHVSRFSVKLAIGHVEILVQGRARVKILLNGQTMFFECLLHTCLMS
jgi:hypothetical protein